MLRWYSRSLRPTYILKPLVVVDIISFLPIFMESSIFPFVQDSAPIASLVAALRLLRVFRLQRFMKDYESFLVLASGRGGDD